MVLAFVMALSVGAIVPGSRSVQVAKAASKTSRLPISCYPLSGRVYTYPNEKCTGKSTGYVDPGDLTKVMAFYTSYSSIKVQYPTAKGAKTAYCKASGFFKDVNFSTATGNFGVNKTVYRKSTGNTTFGEVYGSDSVILCGYANGRTQIIYPVGNGSTYKMGWVAGAYRINSTTNTGATIPDGVYTMVSALNSNYVVDIAGGSSASTANCQLYRKNGSNAQKFKFKYNSDGYYTITNVGSGKVLDCYNAETANGTNVWQYESNNTAAQRWKVQSAGNGYYTLTCKCNNKCLDVSGGYVYNGNNIQIYQSNGTNAQKWKLVAASTSSTNTSSASVASRMVSYELSQLGIGDYKGNNNVKYNTWYWGRTIKGSGYAWCMAFQAYCCKQITGSNSAIPKTASCTSAVNTFKNQGRFYYSKYYGGNYTPKAGDLVFYTNGSRYSSCHVGMITGPSVNGYLQTVEGNIKCSDGNYKVVKFTKNAKRTERNSYVLGYASPAY